MTATQQPTVRDKKKLQTVARDAVRANEPRGSPCSWIGLLRSGTGRRGSSSRRMPQNRNICPRRKSSTCPSSRGNSSRPGRCSRSRSRSGSSSPESTTARGLVRDLYNFAGGQAQHNKSEGPLPRGTPCTQSELPRSGIGRRGSLCMTHRLVGWDAQQRKSEIRARQ